MVNPDEKLFMLKKIKFLESDIIDFIKKDHLCVCNDKKIIQSFIDTKVDNNGKMKSGYYKGFYLEIVPTNRPKVKYLFRFIKYDKYNTKAVCVPLIVNKNKMYILSVYDYDNELGLKYTDTFNLAKSKSTLESISNGIPEEYIDGKVSNNLNSIRTPGALDAGISEKIMEEKKKRKLEQELLIHSNYDPFLVGEVDEKSENVKKVLLLVERVTDKRLIQFFPKHNTKLTMDSYSAKYSMMLKVVYAKAELIEIVSTVDATDLVVVIIDGIMYLVLSYDSSLIQIPIFNLKTQSPYQQLGMLIGAIKHKGDKLRFKRISFKPQDTNKFKKDLSSQLNYPIN